MPQLALISLAIYSFYLLQSQIWLFRTLRKQSFDSNVILFSFGLLVAVLLGITALNMYVYYIDQPLVTVGKVELIKSSENFHSELRSIWEPLSVIPLLIDMGSLLILLGKKLLQKRSILWMLISLLLIDFTVLVVYFSL